MLKTALVAYMPNFSRHISAILIFILLSGCSQNSLKISGKINYVGSSEIYIAKQPVHYKYAEKIRFPISISENNTFGLSVPVDSTQVIDFYIDDAAYPIVAQPGSSLKLDIQRSQFPAAVQISGYPNPWDSLYTSYVKEEDKLLSKINAQLPVFLEGDATDVPNIYRERYGTILF